MGAAASEGSGVRIAERDGSCKGLAALARSSGAAAKEVLEDLYQLDYTSPR